MGLVARNFSKREFSEREKEVLRVLKTVHDAKGSDVVYQGLVEGIRVTDEGMVSMSLQLTENYRNLKKKCEVAIAQIPWVETTRISMAKAPPRKGSNAQKPSSEPEQARKGLQNVKNIIAVSSCKGGVGKSTVSVNLAFTLQKQGYEVGILDADIYGPSLPTMCTPPDPVLRLSAEELIIPPIFAGVRLMSYGFSRPFDHLSPLKDAKQSTVMRGPMASGVIQRLATDTDWGDLDYLVVDFPPGTGDIQLTLAQTLNFNGALVVTTPQRLAHVDVVKGIDMFDRVNVPIVGLVENMSYFKCAKCDSKKYPFGTGKTKDVADMFGFKDTPQLPILSEISEHGDKGDPLVLSSNPNTAEVIQAYDELTDMVISETNRLNEAKLKYGRVVPEIEDSDGTILYTTLDGKTLSISSLELRKACRSAGNKNPELVSSDVRAKEISPRGNYAVTIMWSDGHQSIYPYKQIEELTAQ